MTLNEWIVFGDVGMSSKTMWAVVTGTLNVENIKKFRVEIPYDKDDFSRCYTLWKECGLSDSDLIKIKETCPIWKPFIDNWHELVRLYETNEKMYEYMSELVEQGRLNAGSRTRFKQLENAVLILAVTVGYGGLTTTIQIKYDTHGVITHIPFMHRKFTYDIWNIPLKL